MKQVIRRAWKQTGVSRRGICEFEDKFIVITQSEKQKNIEKQLSASVTYEIIQSSQYT